jgi:hypothetical protein
MSVKRLVPLHAAELASDPVGTRAGEIYFNTTEGKLKFYNGATWELFGTGAGDNNQLLLHTHAYDGDVYSVEEATTTATDIDGGSTIDLTYTSFTVLDGGTP